MRMGMTFTLIANTFSRSSLSQQAGGFAEFGCKFAKIRSVADKPSHSAIFYLRHKTLSRG